MALGRLKLRVVTFLLVIERSNRLRLIQVFNLTFRKSQFPKNLVCVLS